MVVFHLGDLFSRLLARRADQIRELFGGQRDFQQNAVRVFHAELGSELEQGDREALLKPETEQVRAPHQKLGPVHDGALGEFSKVRKLNAEHDLKKILRTNAADPRVGKRIALEATV